MKTPKAVLHQMALDAWSAGLVVLIACLALESVERGSVSRFFNLVWLFLFVLVMSCLALVTQPRAHASGAGLASGFVTPRRPGGSIGTLLYAALLAAAPAAWLLWPSGTRLFWRIAAAGGILLTALLIWPVLTRREE